MSAVVGEKSLVVKYGRSHRANSGSSMLSVHGRIIGGDGGVFEEVELMSVGRCGKYSCVAPVNVVLHVVAMFGRCGFYVANGVSKIIESVTCFVLLNPFDDRSAGLSNEVIVTVLAGNLVDGVHGVRFRSGSFDGVEERHQGGGGGEGGRNIIALECGLYIFVVTSRIGKEYIGRGRGLQLRRVRAMMRLILLRG